MSRQCRYRPSSTRSSSSSSIIISTHTHIKERQSLIVRCGEQEFAGLWGPRERANGSGVRGVRRCERLGVEVEEEELARLESKGESLTVGALDLFVWLYFIFSNGKYERMGAHFRNACA